MVHELFFLEDVDKEFLDWTYMRAAVSLPPIAININGRKYCIFNFASDSKKYLYKEVSSFQEAVEISVSFYGDITLPELAKLASISLKLGFSAEELSIFRKKNIKGRKNIEALAKAALLPDEILFYMVSRDIPLKTVSLLTSFSPNLINFVKDRLLLSKEPSASEFINFVNLTADFKEITEVVPFSTDFAFPERISPERKLVEAQLGDINRNLAPIKIRATDFFEKGQAEFSFKASSYEEYMEICRKLTENPIDVQDFFYKMKNHGLC